MVVSFPKALEKDTTMAIFQKDPLPKNRFSGVLQKFGPIFFLVKLAEPFSPPSDFILAGDKMHSNKSAALVGYGCR